MSTGYKTVWRKMLFNIVKPHDSRLPSGRGGDRRYLATAISWQMTLSCLQESHIEWEQDKVSLIRFPYIQESNVDKNLKRGHIATAILRSKLQTCTNLASMVCIKFSFFEVRRQDARETTLSETWVRLRSRLKCTFIISKAVHLRKLGIHLFSMELSLFNVSCFVAKKSVLLQLLPKSYYYIWVKMVILLAILTNVMAWVVADCVCLEFYVSR